MEQTGSAKTAQSEQTLKTKALSVFEPLAGRNQRPKPSVETITFQSHCKSWPEKVK
jgi:hypothetical protein